VRRIAVIGAGYVGLTTAACLAHLGEEVRCSDVDVERIAGLSAGRLPIVEHGLLELVREGLASGRLAFGTSNVWAVEGAELCFVCVPTPEGPSGRADISYIEAVAGEIGPHLEPDAIVVNKSTVPVGSTHVVEKALARDDVKVVSNPEFLREGSAVHDFLHPDRVVIGADDEATAIRLSTLFIRLGAPLVITDPPTAETIKYASNAFLATKVSFVNALAALCEAVGADMSQVVLGMGYDPRIGSAYLRPGPGWGGSCFPKDTAALVRLAEDAGYDFSLLRGVIAVNEQQQARIVDKAVRLAGGSVAGHRVALWGAAYKAGTDDLRRSPALEVGHRLVALGATVAVYDPTLRRALDGLEAAADPYAAATGASVAVLATEWDELRWLDFEKVGGLMARRAVVDARNLLDPAALRRAGFAYEGVGVL
jgi:UDPglucose 6-dehydrogenase